MCEKIMTQLSGVASTILSSLKMGMCSPMELNRPTIPAILPALCISHPTINQFLWIELRCLRSENAEVI